MDTGNDGHFRGCVTKLSKAPCFTFAFGSASQNCSDRLRPFPKLSAVWLHPRLGLIGRFQKCNDCEILMDDGKDNDGDAMIMDGKSM
jgi:hypothetical protein